MVEKKSVPEVFEEDLRGKFTKIENHTIRFIQLIPTDSFPAGFMLNPGMNSVPRLYMKELVEFSVKGESKSGKEVIRYPGREAIKTLAEIVPVVGDRGVARMSPQVTVHADGTMDHIPDGLPLPHDLSAYVKEEGAILIIQNVKDTEALARWGNITEKYRPAVAKAALERLAIIRGG